jgi:topoisomerase IV subunit B
VPNRSPDSQYSTHAWSPGPDPEHLQLIRRGAAVFAPGGTSHLVLEVLACVADEAAVTGDSGAALTLHRDGSICVADRGRGTDTRADSDGRTMRKPVMTTGDLRFFESPDVTILPDGHPRRGISVVSALSEWLVHTSRRRDGAWSQRYERGIPVSSLTPVPDDGTTGTTVHFRPDQALIPSTRVSASELRRLAARFSPALILEITDQRAVSQRSPRPTA